MLGRKRTESGKGGEKEKPPPDEVTGDGAFAEFEKLARAVIPKRKAEPSKKKKKP